MTSTSGLLLYLKMDAVSRYTCLENYMMQSPRKQQLTELFSWIFLSPFWQMSEHQIVTKATVHISSNYVLNNHTTMRFHTALS